MAIRVSTNNKPRRSSPEEDERVVNLYRQRVQLVQIYDLVYGHREMHHTRRQKISFVRHVLNRIGCELRGSQHDRPKNKRNPSKWAMTK